MTQIFVRHATLSKCFIKNGTNWIAGIIWLDRSVSSAVFLKQLEFVWIGHQAMMNQVFLSVIFLSDNLLVKLKLGSLVLSEQDSWKMYLVLIQLTAFADGCLGEENYCISIFMLSPISLPFLSTLSTTLLTLSPFMLSLLIFIQRFFHTFHFLYFSSTFSKHCLTQNVWTLLTCAEKRIWEKYLANLNQGHRSKAIHWSYSLN